MRIGFLLDGGSISWYPHLAAADWLAISVATFFAQFVLWGHESWLRVHYVLRLSSAAATSVCISDLMISDTFQSAEKSTETNQAAQTLHSTSMNVGIAGPTDLIWEPSSALLPETRY